ncbi:hypothetical protein V6Z05_19535 [Leptospira venezuelensis]|uniref:hypothetical protein n=1 Tax=Leptospira venezuelensis TaxID=1958811 RepID=UPI000A3A14DA|nr:hypothetical protein [Leptospira venezuelensis]
MNIEHIRKLSYRIILIGLLTLLYWVVAFITINVFGLRVFREKLTELFLISILGIFALIAGSFLLNIVTNLTIIADSAKENKEVSSNSRKSQVKYFILFLLSLILLIGFLFLGNYLTINKKRNLLERDAARLISEYHSEIELLAVYKFSKTYENKAAEILRIVSQVNDEFPTVKIIHRITHDSKNVLIAFDQETDWDKDSNYKETDFIYTSSREEKDYINSILDEGKELSPYFEADEGYYKLIYPIKIKNNIFFLLLTDYQRYGKIGS